ncbi:hypothetical protein DAPPUDRAFT_272157 [Daphnia pulex]|uniref:Uncharacterized protein n=1 Tax=Daphnia pulex TaxID=6669 RepID=E9I2T4_DAPPU|nr:hypothetical protein DAPPUDRAFT_272157 [Daphnia pulex]|eukprot:EFX61695.1 hypothetical protein DAPPUDRAFT_272157 [Daphnia pulex]
MVGAGLVGAQAQKIQALPTTRLAHHEIGAQHQTRETTGADGGRELVQVAQGKTEQLDLSIELNLQIEAEALQVLQSDRAAVIARVGFKAAKAAGIRRGPPVARAADAGIAQMNRCSMDSLGGQQGQCHRSANQSFAV